MNPDRGSKKRDNVASHLIQVKQEKRFSELEDEAKRVSKKLRDVWKVTLDCSKRVTGDTAERHHVSALVGLSCVRNSMKLFQQLLEKLH